MESNNPPLFYGATRKRKQAFHRGKEEKTFYPTLPSHVYKLKKYGTVNRCVRNDRRIYDNSMGNLRNSTDAANQAPSRLQEPLWHGLSRSVELVFHVELGARDDCLPPDVLRSSRDVDQTHLFMKRVPAC